MKGKTKEEIIQLVGVKPSLVTNNEDGSQVIKWQMDWYYINILFSVDEKVVRIIDQKVNR